MKKPYTNLLRSVLLGAFSLASIMGFSQNSQNSVAEFQLLDDYTTPTAASASATESCTITNLQGAIGSGTLGIFAVAEQGISTYINPAGDGVPGDPGCLLDEVYPFNITNVQLNPFAAGAFGIPAAEGVGTMVYRVSILEAIDNAGCTELGASLFTSPDQTFTVTVDANTYPATIPVGIDVDEAFFVFVEAVSWSGAANRSPSMVLWNNGVTGTPIPACRQYVSSFNADGDFVTTDFPAFFATAPGWTNVVVNGEAPDAAEVTGPCEAVELTEGVAVVGDNTGATPFNPDLAADAACWAETTPTIHGDVWFSFTAPADGDYLVTTNLELLSNDDTQLLIYTTSDNSCVGDLTLVGCGDDVSSNNFLSEALVEGITAGTTIYILVDGWNGTEGEFQIAVIATIAPEPPANDLCGDAIDLSALTVGSPGDTNTSATFTNVGATVGDGVLPTCFEDGGGDGALENTTWYTFIGTGNTYNIFTNDCDGTAADYIDGGDTQMVIFTGECGALEEVACNEDINLAGGNFAAGLELATDFGVEYTIMIDGFGGADGEFCIAFENMGTPDSVNEAAKYGVVMFPNPAADFVRIQADVNMTNIIVLNSVGQLVAQVNNAAGTDILIDVASYAKGLYFVQMTIDGAIITQKLNVQ